MRRVIEQSKSKNTTNSIKDDHTFDSLKVPKTKMIVHLTA